MLRRFRIAPALAAALAVGSVAACNSDINTPQNLAFGTYTLSLVSGDTLPYLTGEQDGFIWEVLAGSIFAKTDQTCEFRHTYRFTSLSDESVQVDSDMEACTWQLIDQGFHVKFTRNGSLLSGVLAQNALWFDFPGPNDTFLRFMYERTGDPPSP